MNIGCSILAGGKNSRLGGKDKAFLKINNCTIIENNLYFLEQIFEEIILVTNNPEKFSSLNNNIKIVSDKIKNIGPLGGIYSALYHTKKQAIFFTPCDMPFLNKNLIIDLITTFNNVKCDAIIPRINNNIEPLYAIYSKEILKKLQNHIIETKKYSIRSFYDKINVHYLDLSDNETNKKTFTNINTPDDIKNISKKYNIDI